MCLSSKVHTLTGLGVTVTYRCSCPEFFTKARRQLVLPGWMCGEEMAQDANVSVSRRDDGTYSLEQGDEMVDCGAVEEIIPRLASLLHHEIAAQSDQVIVHAGVVEHQGKVLLFPGRSYAGKSTLIKALVDAGCLFYSDEYAVFDPDSGRVAPFPRGLQLRHPQSEVFYPPSEQCAPSNCLGELGAVFFLKFREDSSFEVQETTRTQAVLGLFENTVAAQRYGQRALQLFEQVTKKCRVMTGTRGEATESSRQILSLVR